VSNDSRLTMLGAHGYVSRFDQDMPPRGSGTASTG
jgi:hypothetical protein